MDYLEGENLEVFESHKAKVIENITKSKSMGMNKITAILAIDDEDEIIQGALISWLIKEGYRVSLRKEDYNILVNDKNCNLTPVPNGVGQMTVIELIEQTIEIQEKKEGK